MQHLRRIFQRLLDLDDLRFLQIIIPAYLVMVGILFMIVEAVISRSLRGLFLNLGTELIGAAGTYVLLSIIVGRVEQRTADELAVEERKRQLIRQMGSRVHDVAIEAAEELHAKGWLHDGSLQGANLAGASLQGALLTPIPQGEVLTGVDLQGVTLWYANLQKAALQGANLRDAALQGADLQEAGMQGTNLQGVALQATNLRGADLWGANLQGAWAVTCEQLREAHTLQGTILPDGTLLPIDNTWREVFETWCETAQTDEIGFITPRRS